MASAGKKGKGAKKSWCMVFPVEYGIKGQYRVLHVLKTRELQHI